MKIFTRWTIIMAAASVGCYYAGKAGAFSGLLKYDSSYLGFTIIAVTIAAASLMGKISKEIDVWNSEYRSSDAYYPKKDIILKEIGLVRFAAEVCFDLGLLSTIVGLVMMFLGMGGDVNSLISAIKNGLSTAFIPTLVGMVCNLILRLQMFIAEYSMKD